MHMQESNSCMSSLMLLLSSHVWLCHVRLFQPHELQHTRLSFPSLSPRICSNSCSLSQWWHPTISCHPAWDVGCRPLLLLPSVFPIIRVFSNELALCIRWPKYWSFSFSISTFNEYWGLIPLGLTGLIPLLSKGLSSLLQHHSSKASVLWHLVFLIVQLSHPYMTTGKTIALTRRTFVGKVMFLVFNMLSSLVIAFLPGASVF